MHLIRKSEREGCLQGFSVSRGGSSRPDHGPVRIGTVVKKSNFELDFRFVNLNRNLNWSKFGSGSLLGIQNREPNRRFTVSDGSGRFDPI